MVERAIPIRNKAKIRFFLLNINIREGIMANSRVANIVEVRPDSAVKEQKIIKISVE